MSLEIIHDKEKKMFYTIVEGYKCYISYDIYNGNVYDLEHTIVPSQVGGKGIAAELTKYVLDFAKSNGYKIIPSCSYVYTYIQRHKEYMDIVKN